MPRDSHSAPLLQSLKLESLSSRREVHINKLVDLIIAKRIHPALLDMFQFDDKGNIINKGNGRTVIGKRRFKVFAKKVANCHFAFSSVVDSSVDSSVHVVV